MEFLNDYYTKTSDGQVQVSDQQGSDFAKGVAGDFNPIHHAGSKRFCVPGDLLFAIALKEYGLHSKMSFRFRELIKADSKLKFPLYEAVDSSDISTQLQVSNDRDKVVLDIECSGALTNKQQAIEQMLRNYVAFSGQNFPHILVPLMKQHNVMINPQRPLVIYESMAFEFSDLDFESLTINLEDTSLEVDGKRGTAQLHFSLKQGERQIGSGTKYLVLSGLREYEEEAIQAMCDEYLASKS